MASKGTLTVKLLGDSKPLEQTLKGTGSKLGKFVAGVAAAGAAAAGVVAVKGIEAAREAQKINRLTEQVLETTGGAANVSIEEIEKLNGALQSTTGVSDDLINEGQNLLLTFTNIKNEVGDGNDIFNQATEAALNMSVALGTDMKSGALQLGKALNDPIAGISALSRAGVSFTEQQKEQIRTLAESGDMLGAQKIILGELETQFGGAAEAAADPMQKLQATIGDVVEVVGMHLLPIVDKFATWAAETLPGALDKTVAFIKDNVVPVLLSIGATIAAVTGFFQEHEAAVVAVLAVLGTAMAAWATAATISAAKAVIAWVTTATAATTAGTTHSLTAGQMVLKWAWMGAQSLIHAAKVAAAWVIAMGPIGLVVAAVIAAVALIVANWDTVKSAATAVKDWIVEKFGQLVAFMKELPGKIVAALGDLGSLLMEKGKELIRGFIDGVKSMASSAASAVANAIPGVGSITSGVKGIVGKIPGFDTGGVVPGPVGSPQLILAHGGETVLPTHKRGGGGSVTNNITNHIHMPPGSDGDDVVRALRAYMRRNGPVPITVS